MRARGIATASREPVGNQAITLTWSMWKIAALGGAGVPGTESLRCRDSRRNLDLLTRRPVSLHAVLPGVLCVYYLFIPDLSPLRRFERAQRLMAVLDFTK